MAMKTQQQAEREEQKRIKSLVMNYDLRDDDENDGEDEFHYIYQPNTNTKGLKGLERQSASHASQARSERSGNNRSGHRARKLQLKDVDWYVDYLTGSRWTLCTKKLIRSSDQMQDLNNEWSCQTCLTASPHHGIPSPSLRDKPASTAPRSSFTTPVERQSSSSNSVVSTEHVTIRCKDSSYNAGAWLDG